MACWRCILSTLPMSSGVGHIHAERHNCMTRRRQDPERLTSHLLSRGGLLALRSERAADAAAVGLHIGGLRICAARHAAERVGAAAV